MWARLAGAVAGVSAVGGGCWYCVQQMGHGGHAATIAQPMVLEATAVSQDILVSVLQCDATINQASDLVVKAFQHPDTKEVLKDLFTEEFTENPATVGALKEFLVDKVLVDPWVHEELVGLSTELGQAIAANETIWPGKTLDLLRDASLDALQKEQLLDEVKVALRAAAGQVV